MSITAYIIPIIIATVFAVGFIKRVDVFNEFIEGAYENIKLAVSLLPTLIALMLAVGLMKSSGLLGLISQLAAPAAAFLGFPEECLPLALIRPISGSGALAVYESILSENHPDSYVGRVASVLLGSTETTFYTIAVYFGITGIRKTRHTLFCSLAGDVAGFTFSALLVTLFFGIK